MLQSQQNLITIDVVFLLALEKWVQRILQQGQIFDPPETTTSLVQKQTQITKIVLISRKCLQRLEGRKLGQGCEIIFIDNQSNKTRKWLQFDPASEAVTRYIQVLYF